MIRSLSVAAIFFACSCAIGYSADGNSGHSKPVRNKLYQTSRARLALARVQGLRDFPVVIASEQGKNPEVVAAITAVGGTIEYRADEVDYIEAKVPIDHVESVAERADVTSIDADAAITALSPTPPPSDPSPSPKPRSAGDEAPLLHPYFPQVALQMTALQAAHPNYDGRGITVAVVDWIPDFLLPELQYANQPMA